MKTDPIQFPARKRILAIDIARGAALVAMAIYHFVWDLEYFGWVAPFTIVQIEWVAFARSIAFSFLFLVGVSMVLAHEKGVRWPPFLKRLAMVVAGALAITVATYFATPNTYIFFGILHAIALFSLLGLVFVNRHWLLPLGVALLVLLVWQTYTNELFSKPALLWIGLSPIAPSSNDYVPLFPWFAAVLAGIAFAIWAGRAELWSALANLQLRSPAWRPLVAIGQHSLSFYLLHQPILIGAMWLFTTYIAQPDRTAQFLQQCQTSCTEIRGELFCTSYCTCMVDELKRQQLFTPFYSRSLDDNENRLFLQIRDSCAVRAE